MMSSARPAKVSRRAVRDSLRKCHRWVEMIKLNAEVLRQLRGRRSGCLRRNTGRAWRRPVTFSAPSAAAAIAATSAESIPPLKPHKHLLEAAFAHVIARAANQRSIGGVEFVRGLGADVAAARWPYRKERDPPAKECACARDASVGRKATLPPSNIRLSLPPT